MFYFFEYFDICFKAFANYFDHLLLSPISLSIILIGPIEVSDLAFILIILIGQIFSAIILDSMCSPQLHFRFHEDAATLARSLRCS